MRLAQPVSPLRTPQASGQVPPPSPPRRSSSLSPGQAPKPSRAKKTPVQTGSREFALTNFAGNTLTAFRKAYSSYKPVRSPHKMRSRQPAATTPSARPPVSRALHFSTRPPTSTKSKRSEAVQSFHIDPAPFTLHTEPTQPAAEPPSHGPLRKPTICVPSVLRMLKDQHASTKQDPAVAATSSHWLDMVKAVSVGGVHGPAKGAATATPEEPQKIKKNPSVVKLYQKSAAGGGSQGEQRAEPDGQPVRRVKIQLGKRYGGLWEK